MEKNNEKNHKKNQEISCQLCRSPLVFYGRCGFVTEARCKLSDYIIRQQLREIAEKIDDGGENETVDDLGGKKQIWGTVFLPKSSKNK